MPLCLVGKDENFKIGAYKFRDRKKVAICVEKGNEINVCGYFTSEESAEFFMENLQKLVGAVRVNE